MTSMRSALAAAAGLGLAVLLTVTLLSSAPEPASANPAADFASISSGEGHTCALTTGGGVKCWGKNTYGQLGDGGACGALCPVPVQVTGLTSGVANVAAGANHTCVAMTNGAAKCWGRNLYGAIGDGTTTQRSSPVAVSTLSSGVMAIAAGDFHSCALLGAGTVRCWGRNYDGQVGDGSTTDRLTPVAVSGIASGATGIDAGGDHTCAIVSNAAKCWGRNISGQLGDGTTTSSSSPVSVSGLTGVMQLAAGFNFTCARVGAGGVKCWGNNMGGQLGDGQTCSGFYCSTPVDVSGLGSGTTDLTAGGTSQGPGSPQACALTAGGGKCWGDNWNGELGVDTSQQPQTTPVSIAGDTSDFVDISSGGHHGCAVTVLDGAECWGLNTSGQLGIGTTGGEYYAPQVVVAAMAKATPTPTPSPTPCPACPVAFHVEVDTQPSLGDPCTTASGNMTCSAPLGSMLHAEVYLDGLGPATSYVANGVTLTYTGLASKDNIDAVWPGCVGEAPAPPSPGYVNVGCSVLLGPPVTFLGLMATADFHCSSSGDLTLVHGPNDTLIIDSDDQTLVEPGPTETLTINCVSPAAYPGDTDGDGCPDANEMQPNQLTGGQRNFLNPYDYFNPSHDGKNRVDDMLLVVQAYFLDDDDANPGQPPYEPGYNPERDRTYLGPNGWNLGPPNGLQRVDDILNANKQYFHDCS